MKNIKLVGLLLSAFGALGMIGCAADSSPTETQEPTTEVEAPAPKKAPPTTVETVAAGSNEVETEAVRGSCPPKPGIIRCSCGICTYENECRSLCNNGL